MISHPLVESYINRWENGEIKFNQERVLLVEYLRRDVLSRDDIYFDEQQIDKYIRFSEKNYFPLDEWELFIAPFIFLYFKGGEELFFEQFFITMGRGGGKNGFISTLSNYFISPLHGVKNYDVTIVANSEAQAERSFLECHNKIAESPALSQAFYNGKAKIEGLATKSIFKFATSNAKTKDGGREGCVIYDEIHEMVDDAIVDVFSGGLGKVDFPREFFISTNGFVRGGYYDKMYEKCLAILKGEDSDRIFPFICKLDNVEEMEDDGNWEKANPVFSQPMNKRARRLFSKRQKQYAALTENPSRWTKFGIKQMNLTVADLEKDVTSREKLLACLRDPEVSLEGRSCVAGFDYASLQDFASVGLLFKIGEEFVWKQHSFARAEFLRAFRLKIPIDDWVAQGLLTVVDEPSIDPRHLVRKLVEWRKEYAIELVCADGFRMDLLKPLLEEEGFDYEFLRNPGAIQSKVAPIIEDGFANERFMFGRDQMMLWYTDNSYISEGKDGNKRFLKKEAKRRKTDGFHAFIAALYKRELVREGDVGAFLDALDEWDF